MKRIHFLSWFTMKVFALLIIYLSHNPLNAQVPKKCPRSHEHYECGIGCQTTCATLGENCTIINVKCNDWCYCDAGHARDQTGTCVWQDDCAQRLKGKCGLNEVYGKHNYYDKECSGQILTTGEIPNKRARGCYCRAGYKRHASGVCVKEALCSYPLGWINCTRPNEEYNCGSACQTRCDNIGVPCPIINIRCNDACYCKEGYARLGGNTGPCIPIQRCPKCSTSSTSSSLSD